MVRQWASVYGRIAGKASTQDAALHVLAIVVQPFQRASQNSSGPPDFTSRVDRSLGPACHQPDHYVVSPQVNYSIVKDPCAFGAVASRLRRFIQALPSDYNHSGRKCLSSVASHQQHSIG
jgi:hypothetical protein